MILSASRRTDIPAFYAEWFMNRVREGYALVRNPMNPRQVSRVRLSPDAVDCAVFWTKDAAPMLPRLDALGGLFPFYFQYTLNAYGAPIEPGLPPLEDRLETFRALSREIGAERVVWRYDPVLLSDAIDVRWHAERFARVARALDGFTRTCVLSFIDLYDKIRRRVRPLGIRACSEEEARRLAEAFAEVAAAHGLALRTCAEKLDLSEYGVGHGCCVDGALIERLTGRTPPARRDANQREACGCLESVDIGQYDTCRHGCLYCYANHGPARVAALSRAHDPASPLLVGRPEPEDRITERKP